MSQNEEIRARFTAEDNASKVVDNFRRSILELKAAVESSGIDVGRASDHYEGLRRNLMDAVTPASRLSSELDGLGSSQSNVASEAGALRDALSDMDRAAGGAAESVDRADRSIGASAASIGKAVVGAQLFQDALRGLRDVAVDSVGAFAELETEVANISTIRPDLNTDRITGQLSDLSLQLGRDATALGEGLYNIFSSIEVSGDEGIQLLEKYSKGAIAARTNTETFGTAVTGVLNAYKLGVEDADYVSDVFFNIVNRGVVNGQELATSLGLVTQQAKNAGVTFDELGGLIVGVTKEGGSAAQNINNLSNLLAKITTNDAQKELANLGIITTDAEGKFRSLIDILPELNGALSTMSESARTAAINAIFPDLQARTGLTTLLGQLDAVNAALLINQTQAGATEAAFQTMANTTAERFARVNQELEAMKRQLGEDLIPIIEYLISLTDKDTPVTPFGDTTQEDIMSITDLLREVGEGFGVVTGQIQTDSARIESEVANLNAAFADHATTITQLGLEGGEGWATQLTAAIGAGVVTVQDAVSGNISVMDIKESAQKIGLATGQGYTITTANGVAQIRPALVGEVGANNSVLAQGIAALNEYRKQAGLAQIAIANATKQYASAYTSTAVGNAPIKTPPLSGTMRDKSDRDAGRNAIGDLEAKRNLDAQRKKFEEQYGVNPRTGVAIPTPKVPKAKVGAAPRKPKTTGARGGSGSSGARGTGKTPQQREAERTATAIDRGSERVTAARDTLRAIEAQIVAEQKLENALGAVRSAQDDLTQSQNAYSTTISALKTQMEGLGASHTEAMKPLRTETLAAESALRVMQATAKAALSELDTESDRGEAGLQRVQAAARDALRPLERSADKASATLKGIQDEIEVTSRKYRGLKEAQADALYELGQRESASMGPMDAAIAGQEARVNALREAVEAVADAYDARLLPSLERLQALQDRRKARDDADDIGGLGQTVTNLEARLKNAAKGTQEYVQLEKELARAREDYGFEVEEQGLERGITLIEREKEAAVKAAQERADAEEKTLRRMQEARDAQAALYAEERANIEARMAQIQREEELQARKDRAREEAAQQGLTEAQAALKTEQDIQTGREALMNKYIADIGARREAARLAHEKEQAEQVDRITKAKAAEAILQSIHTVEMGAIQTKIDKWEEQKKADDAQRKVTIDNLQLVADAIRGEQKDAKTGERVGDAKQSVLKAQQDLAEATGKAALANTAFAKSVKEEVAPAITAIGETATPALTAFMGDFEKTFKPKDDEAKIWKLLFAKPDGFFNQLDLETDKALDYHRLQIWGNFANDLKGDMGRALDILKTEMGAKGYAAGQHLRSELQRGLGGSISIRVDVAMDGKTGGSGTGGTVPYAPPGGGSQVGPMSMVPYGAPAGGFSTAGFGGNGGSANIYLSGDVNISAEGRRLDEIPQSEYNAAVRKIGVALVQRYPGQFGVG